MQSEIDAASVVWYHDRQLRERDWPVMCHGPIPPGPSGLSGPSSVWESIAANHRYNGLRQREEARTRRLDVPPAEIAAGKRLVERYDQKRGDARSAIDRALLAQWRSVVRRPDARLSNDTAGNLIDRLSALALQIQPMRAQAHRADADPDHVQAAAGKLEGLLAQRRDLMSRLDALLTDARAGLAYFQCRPRADMPDALSDDAPPDDALPDDAPPDDAPPDDAPPRVLRQDVPQYLPQHLPQYLSQYPPPAAHR